MKSFMKSLLLGLSLCFFCVGAFGWVLEGGNLDKTDFDYHEAVKGRIAVLFYVNPSKRNLNNEASEAIKKENFDIKHFASLAIIDKKSSWLPKYLIMSSLKKKQKKYPRTIYLMDVDRNMHEILDFEPRGNDVFIFDSKGNEIYRHLGKLDAEDILELVSTLKDEINRNM